MSPYAQNRVNQSLCLMLLKSEKYSFKSEAVSMFSKSDLIGLRQALTVHQRLAAGHNRSSKSNDQGAIANLALDLPATRQPCADASTNLDTRSSHSRRTVVVQDHRVQAVHNKLDRIQRALRTTPSILIIPSRLSINMINIRIDFIRLP